jgi:signal peptidase I
VSDTSTELESTEEDESVIATVHEEEGLGDILRTVIYALLLAFSLRVFAFEPFTIPSESMLPNLMVGDYLFVSKSSYGYSRHSLPFSINLFEGRIMESPVTRGDIVVFKLPRDGETDYIKRIMGLPGDRMQMRGGQLFINGVAVRRERVSDFIALESPNTNCRSFPMYRVRAADGTYSCHYPQYRETLANGRSFNTLDINPNGRSDNTRVFIVPDGHYFAMGDNRDNSLDSRRPPSIGVGFVPAENIVGRATVLFWSVDGSGSWWNPISWFTGARGERFFTSLSPVEADQTNES